MRLTPLLVVAAALSAFVVGLGDQYVWSYDETRPGLVAREMVLYGHWLVPYLGGDVYPDKPPLFAWLVALLSPHGVSEWSLRLPAAASAATVGVTYVIAARLAGNVAGLVAAAALASSPAFVHWARTGRMESLLVLWITLAFWSALAWLDTGTRRQAALAGLWMGLGVLTKGPFALLPVPTVALAQFARRPAPVPPRLGIAIAIGVALAVPAVWLGLCAIVDMIEVVSYGRAVIDAFAEEITSHRSRRSPSGIVTVAGGFFPWTLLLPGAVVLLARSWRPAGRQLALPLAWTAVVSFLLTVVVSPRESYFLMLYPPLAIVVGWAWSTAAGRPRLLLEGPLGITLLGCAIVGLGAIATPLSVDVHGVSVPLDARFGATLLVLSAAAASAAVALARAGRRAGVGVVLGAAVLAVVLLVETRVYTPAVNQGFPTRPAAEGFASAAPADTTVLYVDRVRVPALMFYLRQRPLEVRQIADLRALIAGTDAGRSTFTLLSHTEFEALQSTGCRPVRIARQDQISWVRYILAEFRSGSQCLPSPAPSAGLALGAAATPSVRVDDWSARPAGPLELGKTWRVYPFTERATFKSPPAIVLDDGRHVLGLSTEAEAMRVGREVRVDLARTPWLLWEWKPIVLPQGGDVRDQTRNDQAARVMVMFEGLRGILYVWDTTAPVGTEEHPDELSMFDRALIVVRSGTADLGRWRRERRNVASDYRRVFGQSPRPIKWVGFESHSNDTRTRSSTLIGAAAFEAQ